MTGGTGTPAPLPRADFYPPAFVPPAPRAPYPRRRRRPLRVSPVVSLKRPFPLTPLLFHATSADSSTARGGSRSSAGSCSTQCHSSCLWARSQALVRHNSFHLVLPLPSCLVVLASPRLARRRPVLKFPPPVPQRGWLASFPVFSSSSRCSSSWILPTQCAQPPSRPQVLQRPFLPLTPQRSHRSPA